MFMIDGAVVDHVEVNILSRLFTVYSNEGDALSIHCETPKQFNDVLTLCKSSLSSEDVRYVY